MYYLAPEFTISIPSQFTTTPELFPEISEVLLDRFVEAETTYRDYDEDTEFLMEFEAETISESGIETYEELASDEEDELLLQVKVYRRQTVRPIFQTV